ncbi:MAG: hypothetical protein RL208_180, partial [Pseudomonadota bacterium]
MEREGQINNIPDNCKVTIHNNDYIVFNGKQYQITSETTGIFSRKTYPVVTINGIKYVVGPLAKRYPNAILLYDNNQILFIGDTRNILNKLYKIFNSNHGITFNENGQKKYEGGFKNGKYHGKGTEFFLNGQKEYEGGFKNGMYHGKGVWFYSDGEKGYEGEFENGKYHGKGVWFYSDGEKGYEGEFENGKYHGKG